MNDDELIMLVREERARVPMTMPVAEVISRGRSVRARRRLRGLASALAMTAGAVVAVAALVSPGHQAAGQPGAQLAAWTVTRQADGDVLVTIRQLRHPARLASALHADGVPVYIAFADPAPSSCLPYPVSKAQLRAIYKFRQGDGSVALTITPPAIPSGAGLFIFDVGANPVLSGQQGFADVAGRAVHIGVVRASPHCPAGSQSG